MVRPEVVEKENGRREEKETDEEGPGVPVDGHVARGGEGEEQRRDHVVDEVEDGGEEEAEVAVEAHEALLRLQRGEPILEGEDEEEDGGHRPYGAVLGVLHHEEDLHGAANLVGDAGEDAGHAQHGNHRLAATDEQVAQAAQEGGAVKEQKGGGEGIGGRGGGGGCISHDNSLADDAGNQASRGRLIRGEHNVDGLLGESRKPEDAKHLGRRVKKVNKQNRTLKSAAPPKLT